MNSLRLSLVPGLIAGVITIFTTWFWVALVFHRYQRRTPATWRNETAAHHVLSSLIQIAASVAIATLYVMVARGNTGTLGLGIYGAICFVIFTWVAFVAPVLLNHVLYINVSPMVVVGLLLSWLTTTLIATCFTAWWTGLA
jgi:hypothetical protein